MAKVWTRAVWFEYTKEGELIEFEETIPSNWIQGETVYWPKRNLEASIKNKSEPRDDWAQYKLKYVKITDDDWEVCKEYGDNVTSGEQDGEMDIVINKAKAPVTKGKSQKKMQPPIPMPTPPAQPNKRPQTSSITVPTPPAQSNERPQSSSKTMPTPPAQPNKRPKSAVDVAPIKKKKIKRKEVEVKSLMKNVASQRSTQGSPSTSSLPGGSSINRNISVSSPRTPKSNVGDLVNETDDSFSDVSSIIPNYNRRDSAVARDESLPFNDHSDIAFQRIVLRRLAEMAMKIDDIYAKLENMGGAMEKQRSDPFPQPFDNVEAFQLFDKTLEGKKQFKSFVKRLSSVGGSNSTKCVTNMINRMMTNRLQAKYNLAGSKGKALVKLPIQKLNFYKAIIDAVKHNYAKAKDCDVRSCIANSLKNAPYRLDGGKRKISEVGLILNDEADEVDADEGGEQGEAVIEEDDGDEGDNENDDGDDSSASDESNED